MPFRQLSSELCLPMSSCWGSVSTSAYGFYDPSPELLQKEKHGGLAEDTHFSMHQ